MTRRPDSQDRAAACRRCGCHRYQPDTRLNPPALAPSPGWRPKWWERPDWTDLRMVWAYVLAQTEMITTMGARMSEITIDLADLDDATNDVADRVDAQDTKIAELAAALADAQPGSAEAEQLKQELTDASSKVRAATARLRTLAADESDPVPAEDPPADNSGGEVVNPPADGGGEGDPLDGDVQPANG